MKGIGKSPMKVLLAGGNGLLGRAVQRKFPGEWSLFSPAHAEMDIGDAPSVRRCFERYRPEAFLNCAAMTDVDRCEREPATAFEANCAAVETLSGICSAYGVPLCHIGTDYVFDGTAAEPLTEEALPNPINAYGKSKLAGERAVLEGGGCVLRVQWLYGRGKAAFVDRILLSDSDFPIKVVNDCFGSPTYADDAADMLAYLIGSGASGLYHGACSGATSWFGFAGEILARTGLVRRLVPVSSDALLRDAKRPKYTALNTDKLQKACHVRSWQAALGDYLTAGR